MRFPLWKLEEPTRLAWTRAEGGRGPPPHTLKGTRPGQPRRNTLRPARGEGAKLGERRARGQGRRQPHLAPRSPGRALQQGGHGGRTPPPPGRDRRGPAGSLTHSGLAGLAEGVVGEALHEAGLAHPPRPDDDHLQLEVGRARRLLPAAWLSPGERRRPRRRARPEV